MGISRYTKFFWHYAEHVVTIFGKNWSKITLYLPNECIIMEKVKVQVAGLAQLCFEHADIRNHFFQHVLMKNVRKVQEERSRSPDCSH